MNLNIFKVNNKGTRKITQTETQPELPFQTFPGQ